MIKKNIFIIVCLFVLSTSSVSVAYAQEPSDLSPTPSSYDLTYPGLLPDNPLYFLKMARDNLLTFFIGKPVEKASFLLLQSDKQVAASKLLLQQNKDTALVHETVRSSQKYFEEAIRNTIDAKKQGFDTHEIISDLQSASKKHHELIDELNTNLSSDDQKQFDDVSQKADNLVKTAASLKP